MLDGKRVLFLGKLGSMTRRDVRSYVRQRGGSVVRAEDPEIDWVVIGAEELPINYRELIPPHVRDAAVAGRLEIVSETEWWERLGEVDDEAVDLGGALEVQEVTAARQFEHLRVGVGERRPHRIGEQVRPHAAVVGAVEVQVGVA